MYGKWKSRTWVALAVILVVAITISSVCLFVKDIEGRPLATFDDWAGFLQVFVPLMYGLAKGGSSMDKHIKHKHLKKQKVIEGG